MALSTTPVDTNRGTTNITLPAQLSADIWASAQQESAVMQLAQQVTLPGSGLSIQVIAGDATADWVAETAEKPVSKASFSVKTMTPYKIAVIELFSNELRRDLPALYDELARRLPNSIAKKFDATVFNGTAPGSNFDVLTSATAVAIGGTDVYGSLVGAYETLAAADATLSGWAMSPQGKAILLAATDGDSHPLFTTGTDTAALANILGAPVVDAKDAYKAGTSNNPNVVGFAGDWSQARYGIVDGINVSISEEATVNDGTNQINLWQRNMFGLRVEAELGFVVKSSSAFVRLTDAAS